MPLIARIIIVKSAFGMITAYLGIATGVSGVIAVIGPFLVPSLRMAAIIASVLTLIWFLFVGFKLINSQGLSEKAC